VAAVTTGIIFTEGRGRPPGGTKKGWHACHLKKSGKSGVREDVCFKLERAT